MINLKIEVERDEKELFLEKKIMELIMLHYHIKSKSDNHCLEQYQHGEIEISYLFY